MITTSVRPITIDGVRLDTLAWNITQINRAVAARRSADQQVPGRDGVIPSLNDDLEPTTLGLEMFVLGTDQDGAVPATGRSNTFRNNLDELIHLFGKRHALLEVIESMDANTLPATNLAPNPSMEGATQYAVTGSGLALSFAASATPAAGATVLRADVTDSGALTAFPVLFNNYIGANRILASPGAAIGAKFKIRSPIGGARTCFARLRCYNGGTVIADVGNVTFTTSAVSTTWTEITLTGNLPAGCDGFGVIIQGNAAADWANGNRAELDTLMPWVGADPGPYFDGDTPADANYTYAWTGTAHNSASVRNPKRRRRAWAKVTDSIQPDLNTVGSSGMFTVGLELPYGVWEDVDTTDWDSGLIQSNATRYIDTLDGATERLTDAIFTVTGPVTNPRITDLTSGSYVELQGTVAAGNVWRVNCGTWVSRTGTTLTLGSADTAGTDAQAITRFGGIPNQGGFLTLAPARVGTLRRYVIKMDGTARDANTRLAFRARRKYAA